MAFSTLWTLRPRIPKNIGVMVSVTLLDPSLFENADRSAKIIMAYEKNLIMGSVPISFMIRIRLLSGMMLTPYLKANDQPVLSASSG
jgi:hypothetical protein